MVRPLEGFCNYRRNVSVMQSRILWWVEYGDDVFYPSPGIFHFPLVREKDAPYYKLFFIPSALRFLRDEESDDGYSDDLDYNDFVQYVC